MYAALKNRLLDWLFQPRARDSISVVLGQRRVYILPTRQGVVFGAVLVVMVLGSINYTLGLGFILAFLLAALGVNAMIHTYRNIANLKVTRGRAQPAFAGDRAHFTIHLENAGNSTRHAIGLTQDRKHAIFVDVPVRGAAPAVLDIPAQRRGILRPGRLTLFTRFPLGLYYAWAYLELDMQCIVYPRPADPALPLPHAATSADAGTERGSGQEDFSGLRQYHVGDSPRHVAWKAAARDQGLLTKLFSGRAETELWLDWAQLPPQVGAEDRLSHLARWVLDAHAAGVSYGLRLPGEKLDLGVGEAHRERCLEALALFERADGDS
jgi:uncharacterized protein (DUF58 family)